MELDFGQLLKLLDNDCDLPLLIVSDRIVEAGDHGEIINELIVSDKGGPLTFWRTWYTSHYNDDMESWNPDVFVFENVYPVAEYSVRWEVRS